MPGDNGATVFFVDDDPDIRAAVRQGLELADFRVVCFDSAEAALPRLSRGVNGIVVTDIRMPGADGTELMRRVLEIDPAIPVVLVTGHGDVAMAVDAMRAGAYDFIEKPFDTSYLADVVGRAIEKRRLVLENRALRKHLDAGTGLEAVLVGRSAVMARLREQVMAIAAAGADTLVIGETGAGKEVIARALHDFSERKDGPFVAINCGALPAEIFESELFGHESGAFTGAARQRIGKLEHANGGTVFLDEIESMSIDLQVKLLRAIDERGIVRLGANTPIRLNIRFVTATKLDLEAACRAGRFREDLFYRLNVISIRVPPLRERKEDIPMLFHHLAREARARYRRAIPRIDDGMLAMLMGHAWPGNVRELRNAADRFVLQLGETFEAAGPAPPDGDAAAPQTAPLAARVDAFEKALLARALARNGGSVKAACESLGLSRRTFYDKLQKHGLRRGDFDPPL